MNRNDLEKFRNHLGIGREYTFKHGDKEDTFYFEPLTLDYLPDFFYLMNAGAKDLESEELEFKPEEVKTMIRLCVATTRQAFPDASDEEITAFVKKNYVKLQEIVVELNSDFGQGQIDPEKMAKIEELRKRVKKDGLNSKKE